MTFVVVFVQLVAASEILGATLPTAAKSGEIQTPSRAQARVLVPLAAVTNMVVAPESLPLPEVEDVDVLPSPQPTSKVNAPKRTKE